MCGKDVEEGAVDAVYETAPVTLDDDKYSVAKELFLTKPRTHIEAAEPTKRIILVSGTKRSAHLLESDSWKVRSFVTILSLFL